LRPRYPASWTRRSISAPEILAFSRSHWLICGANGAATEGRPTDREVPFLSRSRVRLAAFSMAEVQGKSDTGIEPPKDQQLLRSCAEASVARLCRADHSESVWCIRKTRKSGPEVSSVTPGQIDRHQHLEASPISQTLARTSTREQMAIPRWVCGVGVRAPW